MTQYTQTDQYGNVRYYRDADCILLHRSDGPAVEYASGDRWWYLNGLCHRADGPAYEGVDGSRSWYLNDQRHRILGPAVEYATGGRLWWFLNGDNLTFSEWLVQTPVTDAERLVLALKSDKWHLITKLEV